MSEYYTLGTWTSQGVPNYLDSIVQLPADLISRVITALPEKSNLANASSNLVTDTTSRNILIQSTNPSFNGADVYATFLYEGAGYKNVVGYYVYPLNGGYTVPTKWDTLTNEWIPMTYADRNLLDVTGKSVLKKTVIFPNASLPTWANSNGKNAMAGGGNLIPGSRVKLVYDINNHNTPFPNNTGIGFFLIPNGWNGTTFYNWTERIYTDKIFNLNNSVQAVLLFDAVNSTDTLGQSIISFEDIMRPGGDSDFNDVIIRAEYTPIYAVSNIANIILPPSSPIVQDNIIIDRTGMYLALTTTTFNTIKNGTGTSISVSYSFDVNNTEDETHTINLYNNLLQFDMENNAVITMLDNRITIIMTIPKTEFQSSIYFFNSFRNIDKTSSYNINVSALVEFQNLYVNSPSNITNASLLITNNLNTSYVTNNELSPVVNNFTSPYAMGDPHIMTIYGKKYDLPNIVKTWTYYDDGELNITAQTDYYPFNNPYEMYRDLTFTKFVKLQVGNNILISHMFHKDTYYTITDNKLIKIDNHPFFEINAEYKDYNKRRMMYGNLNNTFQSDIRYIKFHTAQLGDVYIELYHLPHRKDIVNSFTILSTSLSYIPNPIGILVNYSDKYIVDDIPYLNILN